MTPQNTKPYWESNELVEKFAARDVDHRLKAIMEQEPNPSRIRALDIGCAAGRNTLALASIGVDVYAVDSSSAMIAKTRERLTALLGLAEAERRVSLGFMQALAFPDQSFDLVIALGVYHNADGPETWNKALGETARVLKPGGRLLTALFSPRSNPTGKGLTQVPGVPHLYHGFTSEPLYLMDPVELDVDMKRLGLEPLVPTTAVTVPMESGLRVTVNGLYQKQLS